MLDWSSKLSAQDLGQVPSTQLHCVMQYNASHSRMNSDLDSNICSILERQFLIGTKCSSLRCLFWKILEGYYENIHTEFKREVGQSWVEIFRKSGQLASASSNLLVEIFRKSGPLASASVPPQTPPTSWALPLCRAASMLRWLARTNTSARDT